jgi:hypothetical protein
VVKEELRRFSLEFWTEGDPPKRKKYTLPFRNLAEAHRHLHEERLIAIRVVEIKPEGADAPSRAVSE